MADRTCGACAWRDDSGRCRRRSPAIGRDSWPVVEADSWCGEFRASAGNIDYRTSIFDAGLSTRAVNALNRAGAKIIADAAGLSHSDLERQCNIGVGTIREIVSLLDSAGLDLGMHPSDFLDLD